MGIGETLNSFPHLVADIGGSNARFGWVTRPGSRVDHVHTLPVARYATVASAIEDYLAQVKLAIGTNYSPPARAAFAVASAVSGDRVALTNSSWSFSTVDVARAFSLTDLRVLNDFEALATAVPYLSAAQFRAPPDTTASRRAGTLAVIGPGTGMGVAGVTPCGSGWVVVSGEGGHATLAATDEFEAAVLAAARRDFAHVSAERLLSGIGLPTLHQAIARVNGQAVAAGLTTETIVAMGVSGADVACAQTLQTFCALLGSFAGSTALTLGARGGVYIAGGIVPRFADYFFASRFREKFVAKGRFQAYLESIPTFLITDTLLALDGCARALSNTPTESEGML